jgi:transposase
MAKEIFPEELWGALDPLFPSPPPRPKGGRRRIPNRATLTGILFVLRTGIPWEWLPQKLGCGSGMTCWRWLRDWQAQGVWQQVHRMVLNALGDAGQIDWSRAAIDSATVPAPWVAKNRAQSNGSRQIGHEAPWYGRPARDSVGLTLSGANVPDGQMVEATPKALEPIKQPCGRPRKRPAKLHADKAYDAAAKRHCMLPTTTPVRNCLEINLPVPDLRHWSPKKVRLELVVKFPNKGRIIWLWAK